MLFRRLVSIIAALLIATTQFVNPVYAESTHTNTTSINPPIAINNRGNNNLVYIKDSFNTSDKEEGSDSRPDSLTNSVVSGLVNTVGTAAATTLACYAIDGLAAVFFPPAAAAAAIICPSAGAVAGGGHVLVGNRAH